MILETYSPSSGTTFDIEIAPAPVDGKRHPIVILIHGNLGLASPYGEQLRDFTEEIAALGYLAALPTYYPRGESNPRDVDIASHLPALTAAIRHLSARPDADLSKLGLVGFSLGGGVAMSYIASSPAGTVRAFADFYGLLPPGLGAGASKFPPTIIFHNTNDPVVPVAANSAVLARALEGPPRVEHEYHGYDDDWEPGYLHALKPGGPADLDSRKKTKAFLSGHLT